VEPTPYNPAFVSHSESGFSGLNLEICVCGISYSLSFSPPSTLPFTFYPDIPNEAHVIVVLAILTHDNHETPVSKVKIPIDTSSMNTDHIGRIV
jgi:hypothetical protein